MSTSTLNPNASVFCPSSPTAPAAAPAASKQSTRSRNHVSARRHKRSARRAVNHPYLEQSVTVAELQELEDVDAWVELMVDLDQAERDHLIAFALAESPAEVVEQLRRLHQ
ncbi:MAG: hypothetical protein WDW38_004229 [Sanguina aurantia]